MNTTITVTLHCAGCKSMTSQDVDIQERHNFDQIVNIAVALSTWVRVDNDEILCPACWHRQRRGRTEEVTRTKSRMAAASHLLYLASCKDVAVDCSGFLHNAALWAMGFSGLDREAVIGYEEMPGIVLFEPKTATKKGGK